MVSNELARSISGGYYISRFQREAETAHVQHH